MVKVNPHYQKIDRPYIFGVIEEKLEKTKRENPDIDVLNLGVGDICKPLCPTVINAVKEAVDEMGEKPVGYGSPFGYSFLREAIVDQEYKNYGISADEIFISDGTKSDSAGLQELFCRSAVVGITDPTYPTYVDVNIMDGRHEVKYLPCTKENHFVPQPPDFHLDLVYLCTPNNPTGTAMKESDLLAWISYAKKENAILLIDAAYERFITSKDVPRSIFSLPGAREVAIEMRTFSKSAGFTGLRCAYTVVPRETELLAMWKVRQNNKCNGVSYPVQKGAAAALTEQGTKETGSAIAEYQKEMEILRRGLQKMSYTVYGGEDAPYLFWKTPNGETSWEFFDTLLEKCHLISIPASSFGPCGEGYVRLSGFLRPGVANLALSRIKKM